MSVRSLARIRAHVEYPLPDSSRVRAHEMASSEQRKAKILARRLISWSNF